MPETIVAAVLAAGESRRMGDQKLLLPLAGKPMVRWVVEAVRASSVDDLIVVVGREAGAIRAALKDLDCTFVVNPRYREGIGTSFRAAIDSFASDVAAALFALGDQPFVTTAMFEELLATYRTGHPLAVISRYAGVVAPPHLFSRALFADIGTSASLGAKALLEREAERCIAVTLPEQALFDVDDRADYERAEAVFSASQRSGKG